MEQTQETELGKITHVTATDSRGDLPPACPACLKINQSNSQPTGQNPMPALLSHGILSADSFLLSLNWGRHLSAVQLERAINFMLLSNTHHLVPWLKFPEYLVSPQKERTNRTAGWAQQQHSGPSFPEGIVKTVLKKKQGSFF